jgi:hypothetical protein
MLKNKIIETEINKIWLGEDGILYVDVFPNAEVTLDTARKSSELRAQLAGSKARPMLIDMSKIKSMTREARNHYSKAGRNVLALALVVKSPVSKVIGNLFLGLNKPSYPVRLYISKSEAIEWLKTFLKKIQDERFND